MNTTGKHKSHAELRKPALGRFGRNELAIYGTTCEAVHQMANDIRSQFSQYDIGYVDADHHPGSNSSGGTNLKEFDQSVSLHLPLNSNDISKRILLSHVDAVIINGNHFEATSQMICCNRDKEASLRKRARQLNNVVAVLLEEGELEIPDYIIESCDVSKAAIFSANQKSEFYTFYRNHFLQPPLLQALILAGGASVRMGEDKSLLTYRGREQFLFLTNLTQNLGLNTFISCRAEQAATFEAHSLNVLNDRLHGLGPLGGIVSAFMSAPDAAWLVLACDMPLLEMSVIEELITGRKHQYMATCFNSPFDGMPEPLISIWEPKSYSRMMQFISQGYSCPRKVLMNSKTNLLDCTTPDKLKNVNTNEERLEIELLLKNSPGTL